LEFNVHEVPVFCPLDDVQRTDYTLGDINFVTRALTDCVKQLGYTGPGWQHRAQTEWLLYTAVIGWEDIPWKLTATGRLPHDVFRKPLETMEKAWDNGLGKQSINSMIGLWCLDETFNYKLTSSDHAGDAPPNALKRIVHHPGGTVTDYITKTKLLSSTSHRPLHDLAMCTEAVRVGQMLYVLRKQRAIIYELKTDSVLYKPAKRAKGILEDLAFKDLRLRDLFDTQLRSPGQRTLEPQGPRLRMAIDHSCEKVFRVTTAGEKDPMKMEPKAPKRSVVYTSEEALWHDVSEEEAARIVINGGSMLCLGIAGTGKTTFLKGLVERLKALGKRVDIISKTHTASERAGGCTADHYVRRHILHGACLADVIWVDEISQLEVTLWAQLNKLKRQWLLSGDFNQFPPIYNSWRGCVVDEGSFERSGLLHELAGGNRLTLTECRRTGPEIFGFYSSLVAGGGRWACCLEAVLAEARALFKFEGAARHNLVISHRKRVRINKELNQQLRPEGALLIRAKAEKGQTCSAQNMFIWEGIELLGCTQSTKKGVRNNVVYRVVGIDDDVRVVKKESSELITLSYAQVAALLRLSYAQTYASCQGAEFDDSLRLHDTSSRHFTKRHLFVALSRSKAGQIDIVP